MASSPRRHFLPWSRPLLPQVVEFLAQGWDGRGPLDLSRQWVVVPTRQSGRRLREALAAHAAGRGQAVFAPRVLTPESLIAESLGPGVASRVDSLLAWAEVLRTIDLAEFRQVFPVDPPARNFSWALRLAEQFSRLQVTLAESGLRLADVAPRGGADFPELDRWRQLGDLEVRHAAVLQRSGLRDGPAARIMASVSGPMPPVERVVQVATADPMPLALVAVERVAALVPVDVLVFAPEDARDDFDRWGRPCADRWAERILEIPCFEQRVHLRADPAAEAELLVSAAQAYARPDGMLAFGVADAEIRPLLERALNRREIPVYNPEGHAARHARFFHFLSALAELLRRTDWSVVAVLARCPDFLDFLAARQGSAFSVADWLAALDDLRRQHLPATLEAALEFPGRHEAGLRVMAELRAGLQRGAFPENAAAVLAELFAARRPAADRVHEEEWEALAAGWTEILRASSAARSRFAAVPDADWWDLALRLFAETTLPGTKPAGALELHGWLELLFEDAPHLVVAGMNEGSVPDAVLGDAFLPESLRVRLGLKTNAVRFARDAYLLQAMAASRPRLDLVLAKVTSGGDPRRPSRLLLRCAPEELPRRVGLLFAEPKVHRVSLPWTRAWSLTPRRDANFTRVAVTALRSWLDCPFRFYLRHGLRMEAVDPAKEEMDALDFGILVHGALEALGREEALRACTDPGVLREFLGAALDRQVRRRYGQGLSLPLLIQLESARQRLGRAAELEAQERADGWRTIDVERKFSLEFSGLTVAGKIDRIDRHESTGAVRVLDYKTSDRAIEPQAAHLRKLRAEEVRRDWTVLELDGEPWTWIDLQLPVYEWALAAEFGSGITCGYFNLPKAIGDAGIAPWEPWTPEMKIAARHCTEQVCAAIRAADFWPPREISGRDAERDPFASLFHQGAAASLDFGGKGRTG